MLDRVGCKRSVTGNVVLVVPGLAWSWEVRANDEKTIKASVIICGRGEKRRKVAIGRSV